VAHDLEGPSGGDPVAPDEVYLARGEEVSAERPAFTGDVYSGVPVISPSTGDTKNQTVILLQHPCAFRSDGVNLADGLAAAIVRPHPVVQDWKTHGKLMPLPVLRPEVESAKRNQAALFDDLRVVRRVDLEQSATRIACLSQEGVDLLLQRWVNHNSRVVVPTHTLDQVVSGPFEEADLVEEWCVEAASFGAPLDTAASECLAWLRADIGNGETRQTLLEQPRLRSRVRRESSAELKSRAAAGWSLA
jgi:hypothetical protein